MGTPLSPVIPATPTRSKIVFPAQPPQVPDPVVSSVAGGSLPATTYYVKATWVVQTQDGVLHESMPSNEVKIAVDAGRLLVVQSPPPLTMPYILVGWNVYVGTSSSTGFTEGYGVGPYGGIPYGGGVVLVTPSSVGEVMQNANAIAIGTNWQEPLTGLIAGTVPPSSWGTTLMFNFPGRGFPYSNREAKAEENFSTDGVEQSIVWYVDDILDFQVPYIQDGDDVAAWDQFLDVALARVPWDFYRDSTQAQYQTMMMTDASQKLSYHSAGLWAAEIKARQVILTI